MSFQHIPHGHPRRSGATAVVLWLLAASASATNLFAPPDGPRSTSPVEGGSSCCVASGGAGCDDPDCSDLVCFQIDPFCCMEWDAICAGYASSICTVCGGSLCPGGESCCTGGPNQVPKCSDTECCGLVCNLDPVCCAIGWDSACRGLAQDLCTTCGGGDGSCCEPHESLSCEDEKCALAVCADDPFCCETEWDASCVAAAADLCDPLLCADPLLFADGFESGATCSWSTSAGGDPCPADP